MKCILATLVVASLLSLGLCLRGPAFSTRYASPLGDLMYPGSFNPGLEFYNPRVRPNQGQQGPVEVVVNMYLRAVEDVDAEKNTMKLQITFRQQWVDRRLRFNSSSANGQNSVITIQRDIEDRIWTPDTFFRNSVDVKAHDLPTPNAYARVEPDGSVTLSNRFTVTALDPSMEFSLKNKGYVEFKIDIASYGWRQDDLTYEWKETNPFQITKTGLAAPLSLMPPSAGRGNFFSTSHCDVTTSTGTYSCLRLKLTFYCTEGTKVKACFDENGALTFPRD